MGRRPGHADDRSPRRGDGRDTRTETPPRWEDGQYTRNDPSPRRGNGRVTRSDESPLAGPCPPIVLSSQDPMGCCFERGARGRLPGTSRPHARGAGPDGRGFDVKAACDPLPHPLSPPRLCGLCGFPLPLPSRAHKSICRPISMTCSGGMQKCVVAERALRTRKAKRLSLTRPMLPAEVARNVSRPRQ